MPQAPQKPWGCLLFRKTRPPGRARYVGRIALLVHEAGELARRGGGLVGLATHVSRHAVSPPSPDYEISRVVCGTPRDRQGTERDASCWFDESYRDAEKKGGDNRHIPRGMQQCRRHGRSARSSSDEKKGSEVKTHPPPLRKGLSSRSTSNRIQHTLIIRIRRHLRVPRSSTFGSKAFESAIKVGGGQ